MLAGSGAGMGSRTGAGRAGNGTGISTAGPGPNAATDTDGGRFEEREYSTEVVYSGSDQDSDSVDDEDTAGSGGDRRGVKRERSERELGHQSAPTSGGLSGGYGGVSPGVPGAKPGKKTRGRVKIKMEFIDNKLRRYTTFSKRKTGIMKKAYELSTLTGTQVLLLVASETGHVYTFATRKLQPMITSETGKALIQTCLNSPDSPPRSDPSSDQRMSATGFEETDLNYQVSEADSCSEVAKDVIKPAFTMSNLPGTTQATPSSSSSSVSMQVQTSAPSWQSSSSTNGTVLKTSAGVVLPGGFTLMSGASLPPGTHTIPLSQLQGPPLTIQGPGAPGPTAATTTLHTPPTPPTTLLRLPATVSLAGGGVSQQLQTIQVQPSSQQTSTNQSSSDINNPASSTASLSASIVSSSSSSSSASSSVAGHMMYPGGHTVMYAAPTPSLGDGSLTVLNTFPSTGHGQSHDPGPLPQVFLTSLPPVAAQIPVSAVQLHPMVISQQSSSNLTELQVVSLDVHQSKDD
ncbi:serum response factor-like isoform X1 [Epinephelus lanceolatus]|uniref:serum response factor-like isoform X1 n=1 Tax=Epinephelus lanceolatus TaxID=310571 RepID=UPI0014473862|nr:serum response factor-like isoform X1 [Epinephelus lanceolatus]